MGNVSTADHHDRGRRCCIYALFSGRSIVFGKLQQSITVTNSNHVKNSKHIAINVAEHKHQGNNHYNAKSKYKLKSYRIGNPISQRVTFRNTIHCSR